MTSLIGKIIAVSGASRGIGYYSALEAARCGAHVIAIARTVGGLEELDDEIQALGNGSNATLVPMNILEYDTIDHLGAQIAERWGKLDGFIANAGILGGLSPLGHIDPKTFDIVMATNVTANWRFIRSFDPLFKKSDAARVVMISSGTSRSCKAFWGAYSISKAALEALAKTYANECINSNIRTNLFSPGAVRTAMRAQAMPGEDPDTISHPQDVAVEIVKMLGDDVQQSGLVYDYTIRQFLNPTT